MMTKYITKSITLKNNLSFEKYTLFYFGTILLIVLFEASNMNMFLKFHRGKNEFFSQMGIFEKMY